ncbi:aminotransferase class V-fold PLP-dependent enzyme [Paraglaciecola aquimarina]|uniref:cysteine desulfurase n=1 Tax=Paraglaciecola aquimarina TaxID=1235557 RepID=A0ABU3SZ53_9ALTE|nr:aminotransferase class V-fold PLP-dependent enzyme [Paraglaciecola aquimarina]MDU0355247.1 aminotransferase class V-fold PLP-dependent enzyme [Paraglaciecola aquimarina]
MSATTFRHLFPILVDRQPEQYIYFDSAATSLKLASVIHTTQDYYQSNTSNVHRSSHKVAQHVTEQFEQARRVVQQFINAKNQREVIWTQGATDSLNLLAQCLGRSSLLDARGTEILIAATEHHSNIVPWQELARQYNLVIKVMPVDANGVLKLHDALQLISKHTAIVAIGHVSNALGNINPVQAIIQRAKAHGAISVIDGTQAVAHMPVDVVALDCDFYVFSGHKIYGPTGIGVLYGKLPLLEALPPYRLGGEMVKTVSFKQAATFQPSPLKFEAGTPNIAGVLGLAEAIKFIESNMHEIMALEQTLYLQLLQLLENIPEVTLWGDKANSISLQSFTVKGVNVYDLALLLDSHNIALRVGHHCAMPLFNELAIDGVLRVSLSCYNNEQELALFDIALRDSIATLSQQVVEPDVRHKPSHLHNVVNEDGPLGAIALSIKSAKGWDNSFRQLMLAGKGLARLTEADKLPSTEVLGCESQVWIKCEWHNQQLNVSGDSPSKIVRGLLAVIFEVLNGQNREFVLAFDISKYLATLGLARHLSESRGNGLTAVVEKIMLFCKERR